MAVVPLFTLLSNMTSERTYSTETFFPVNPYRALHEHTDSEVQISISSLVFLRRQSLQANGFMSRFRFTLSGFCFSDPLSDVANAIDGMEKRNPYLEVELPNWDV